MSKLYFVLSCAMVVLLPGCFSSVVKKTVVDDRLVMSKQDVTLRYQKFYENLPGNDWARYQYRHVAENRSAEAVCVHLEISRERAGEALFTTHVILQPGQKRTMSSLHWQDILPSDSTFFQSSKLEGTGCTEHYGWSMG